MSLIILGVIAIIIFILEEFVFSASRYFWVGGIVPIIWTLVLAYLVVMNAANLTVADYALAIVAVVVPYVCWGNGFQRRAVKRQSR